MFLQSSTHVLPLPAKALQLVVKEQLLQLTQAFVQRRKRVKPDTSTENSRTLVY